MNPLINWITWRFGTGYLICGCIEFGRISFLQIKTPSVFCMLISCCEFFYTTFKKMTVYFNTLFLWDKHFFLVGKRLFVSLHCVCRKRPMGGWVKKIFGYDFEVTNESWSTMHYMSGMCEMHIKWDYRDLSRMNIIHWKSLR